MLIKYRPNRPTLAEALADAKEFNTIDEMYDYVVSTWKLGDIECLSKEDLSIAENLGKDERCGWKETRYVCTTRILFDKYKTPQCIGMCSIEE